MTILSARRAPAIHRASRSQQPGIVLGLRYERSFVKQLRQDIQGRSFSIEYNPWFFYTDSNGTSSACAPDVLLIDNELDTITVIECKYTWVPDAIDKLNRLYCPIVEKVLHKPTHPLVVVKRLTPQSPKPGLSLLTSGAETLFQWLGSGSISL